MLDPREGDTVLVKGDYIKPGIVRGPSHLKEPTHSEATKSAL